MSQIIVNGASATNVANNNSIEENERKSDNY